MSKTIIRADGLRKVFGDFVANEDISFEIEAGKIYAMAGENGAGKSTLMKMIYGVYKIDGGKLFIDGEEMTKYSPTIAREKGLGMVFQDFRLVPAFTALENVFLSTQDTGFYFDRKTLRNSMEEISRKYELHVNPDEFVWRLDLGQRQHIEIIKVLMNSNTRVLIFDEPTSVLAPNEIDSFLNLLKMFRDNGFSILLITHKIHEIVRVADMVHILRKGKLVHTFYKEDGFSEKEIVSQMIGEEGTSDLVNVQVGSTQANRTREEFGDVILKGRNITIQDDYGRPIIHNSNFDVAEEMILGVAGISGNGQRELTEALYGIRPIAEGKIELCGQEIQDKSTKEHLDRGMRILSEDPIRDNLIPDYTVLQHMAISGFKYKKIGLNIDWLDLQKQMDDCQEISQLNVPESNRRAEKLSGGNIQRMAFARAVISYPKVLIASYPSRGLDIATVAAVHDTLRRLKANGTAILFISEDLNELFKLSDRLIVLSENAIHGPFTPDEYDAQAIGGIMLKGEKE